ncbi:MAG: TonB-dependent receptor [Breznakibacter sp.]
MEKRKSNSKGAKLRFVLMFCLSMLWVGAWAQQKNVQGSVTDAQTGESMPGVSVLQKGTTNGTVTDINGKYELTVTSDNATLIFSFIGYQTVERVVEGAGVISVAMVEETTALDAVVVIGYGTTKKKDLTTAVVSVSDEDIKNRPIMSAAQAIQGKAAGVMVVQPSGKPGVGMTLRVRGSTSINASNEPLYVVDGFPTSDISNINPTDIESMQILKDASSSAIYGARASNGVVLITTKRGKTGEAKVTFEMQQGITQIGKTIDVLNTAQYRDLMDEVLGVGTVPDDITNNTDWNKEVFKTGTLQNYQLSISGGNEKVNYFVSGGYQNEKGIVQPAEFDRYSFRVNVDNQVKSWLKMTTSLNYSNTHRRDAADNVGSGRGGVILSVLNTPPFLEIWDPDNPGQYATNPYNPSWENPLAQASTYDMNHDNRIMGNVALEAQLTRELKFKSSLGVDYTGHQWDRFVDPVKTNYGRVNNGIAEADRSSHFTWLNENILTFDKSFGGHNLSLLGGFTMEEYRYDNSYIYGTDFPKGVTLKTLNFANNIGNASTSAAERALVSYVGRAAYNFESKYLLTFNFRADGSSKFAPDYRWGYFPSVSAGWRMSSEPFFEGLRNTINDLKLRGGWGINGNQEGIGNYDYYGRYSTSRVETTGNGPALNRSALAIRDLTWETTEQINLGVDVSMYNSRLTAALDVYYKHTQDLLLETKIPESTGLPSPTLNNGEMENKGIELELTGRIIRGGDFTWDMDLNVSHNKNEVTRLGLTSNYYYGSIESNGQNIVLVREDLALGSFYGYKSQGVDPETGNMIYADLNNNGYTDPEDRTIIGNGQPDFIYGFTNRLSYKNWDLSFFFQGSQGNDIFNATRVDTEGMFDAKNQSTNVLRRWKRPGMETDVPRSGSIFNAYNSSRFVEDGSYLRLKNVTIAYRVPKSVLQKARIESLSVYVTANNLLTITDYSGYDPEVNSGGTSSTLLGVDYGTYPQNKSVVLGLNLTF